MPLGSPQSRAAARVVLTRRFAGRKRIDLIVVSTIPRPRGERIQVGEWRDCENGILRRTSFLPPGMTIQEAEGIVAERIGRPTAAWDADQLVRRTLTLDL
jgi:hypothetical protein